MDAHPNSAAVISRYLEPGIGATYPSPCGAVKVQSSLSLCPDVHSTGLVLWMVMLRYYGCSARAICNLPKERSCVLSGPGIRGATNLAFFFFLDNIFMALKTAFLLTSSFSYRLQPQCSRYIICYIKDLLSNFSGVLLYGITLQLKQFCRFRNASVWKYRTTEIMLKADTQKCYNLV